MAYLHCHSCDWSQDDFWDWRWTFKFWKCRPFGYNPLSILLEDIAHYIKPRIIEWDTFWAEENGFKSNKIHSWNILLFELKRLLKGIPKQKWWTYKSWQKDKDKAVCPKCGKQDFDID